MDTFESSSELQMGERNEGAQFVGAEDLTDEVIIHDNYPIFVGSHSHLYKGTCYGYRVAIKVLRAVTSDLRTIRREVKQLWEVWGHLDHPNITPLYGYTKESVTFGAFGALVFPFYSNGDARSFLAEHGSSFTLEERKSMLKGVVDGMIYLHTHEPVIIHGDLKPGNILMDDFGNPRICDIGLLRIFSEDERKRCLAITEEPVRSARYLAPELVMADDGETTTETDVYALGCVALEFLFLQVPYHTRKNNGIGLIMRDIAQGIPPAYPPPNQDLSDELKHLWVILDRAWSRDVPSRLDAFGMLDLFKAPRSL